MILLPRTAPGRAGQLLLKAPLHFAAACRVMPSRQSRDTAYDIDYLLISRGDGFLQVAVAR